MTEATAVIPETCEVKDCSRAVETYCPLCEKFLCVIHDELVKDRGHDCLNGTCRDG